MLFLEDYKIDVEKLARYGIGLGLYHCSHSIYEARSQVLVAVENLKASSLLLEAEDKDHVKMQDMVSDFALWTTSKGDNVFFVRSRLEEWPKNKSFEDCTAIYLTENKMKELPDGLICPKLEFCLLWQEFICKMLILDGFFEGMKSLKFLTLMRGVLSQKSLRFCTNLRTL